MPLASRRRLGRAVAVGIIVVFLLVGGTFAYTYSQLSVSVVAIEFQGIRWTKPSAATVLRIAVALATDNYLGLALSLVDAIVLRLTLQINNPSFIPLGVPAATWSLRINGIHVGTGTAPEGITVSPSSIGLISALQEVRVASLPTLATAIAEAGGNMEMMVDGALQARLLVLPVHVPFRESQTISLVQELERGLRSLVGGGTTPSTTGFFEVVESYWTVGASRVTSARGGTTVTGHVVLRGMGNVDMTLTLSVRQDRIALPDREMATRSLQVSLRPGQTQELTITFTVETGLTVRGYFLRLEWSSGGWQQDGYPPRLRAG